MTHPIINPVAISGIDQIDLDSHAVIEASAGTGKTYTIENLVVALLKSGRITNLEEILVVTFTEKAAGELKDRIRQNIKNALVHKTSQILQTSLDNFDSASIFTIHGFCNAILQEYAFENREQFNNELADDRVLYQQALYQIMRDVWPLRFGKELQNILTISHYPGSILNGTSSWEKRVLDLATRYQPFGNDRILPEVGPDLLSLIHDAEINCRFYLKELKQLIGPIDMEDITRSDFPVRYACLNINKNSMGKRLRIIGGIAWLVAESISRIIDLNDLDAFFSTPDLNEFDFNELNSRWKKDGADYEEKLPHLPKIIQLLEKLRALDIPKIHNLLMSATVHDLKNHALQYKQTKGLISYDDMVNRVYQALAGTSSLLKNILRQKYRYALVDEFQDTDILQWKIFRAIFLDSRTSRLFIIGDPKQSIYGFRGADVHAYYIARDEMIHTHGARYYCLNENWRSSPDLISSFNTLFTGTQWFSDSNIHYLPSHYPDKQDPEMHPDNKSLIVMDCGNCSGTAAKYRSAHFIARELKRIITEDTAIHLNDIAILVTKWKEAEIIEKFLKEEKISYSLYKKEGLYQSTEVLELYLLLTAIADPHDFMARKKALISRFFRVPVQQLYHYAATADDHPANALFKKWINLADQKQWSLLFQSVLEDTGILFCTDIDDHDRAIINYRSVVQKLEIEAYRKDFSIQELVDYLNGLRRKDSFSHDSYNIEAIDLEKPGVQILTIHASKGLQFKIVFIAGGYTKRARSEFWTYHDDGCRIFDLVMNPGNKELFNLEIASEDERLFYVALTRARDRLYIPVYEPGSKAKNSAGMLGDKLYSALSRMRKEKQVTWLDVASAVVVEIPDHVSIEKTEGRCILPDQLFPEISANFMDRKIFIDSFSSLKIRMYDPAPIDRNNYQFDNPALPHHEDDEPYASPGPMKASAGSLKELPHSKETGIMLHAILEHIDFKKAGTVPSPTDLIVGGTDSSLLIEHALQNHLNQYYGNDPDTMKNQTARIIWNTLNAPLDGSNLFLKLLDKRIHEVEFYYPFPQIPSLSVPETTYHQGFMHGFIDMIFIYQNKYYIIDWKSNYIEKGYSRDLIEKNIIDMHYDLQMHIYGSALLRWLHQIIPGYNYDSHFGGIYYLYLRGMDSGSPRSGIYFHRPVESDIKDFITLPDARTVKTKYQN